MTLFSKKEEKKPFSFASVEMQKAPRSNTKWVIILIAIIIVLIILFWK